jgi:hypothetical protein
VPGTRQKQSNLQVIISHATDEYPWRRGRCRENAVNFLTFVQRGSAPESSVGDDPSGLRIEILTLG